jgi:hypothetical protein
MNLGLCSVIRHGTVYLDWQYCNYMGQFISVPAEKAWSTSLSTPVSYFNGVLWKVYKSPL